MEAAARESGKTLTVCFQNRYNGASKRMKEVIGSGLLGRILGGSAFVTWNRAEPYYQNSPWRGRWATSSLATTAPARKMSGMRRVEFS